MAKIDEKYHKLLQYILDEGRWYEDPNRKGVKRLQIPKYNFEYNLKEGFPAISTKKLFWKGVVGELLWFLRGDTNIKYLVDNNINIWNKDAYKYYLKQFNSNLLKPLSFEEFISYIKNPYEKEEWNFNLENNQYNCGNLGRIYGAQWRKWKSFKEEDNGLLGVIKYAKHTDQIFNLIKNLKEKPLSTEHIVTAWNPAELNEMALPPCHKGFQLMVYELTKEERLNIAYIGHSFSDIGTKPPKENIPKYGFDLVWEQRSVDTFLGLPFNIASYALLAHIIGKMVNMIPGKIYGDLRNVHLYDNAIEGAKEQLSRSIHSFPCDFEETLFGTDTWHLELDEWLKIAEISDFKLNNYKPFDPIYVEMLERDNQ